jgi:SAM-dependent methyltransferase/UDP-N-acetylglucosamine transferase subunit ALG13
MKVFVTVGMGPWPFDRLLAAVRPLCQDHDVFVQTGPSTVPLPCESAAYLTFEDAQRRIVEADLVITHAGNTVRLVQRAGKLPVAVAREAARGEMGNDHQATYLREEEAAGRVLALWGDRPDLVDALRRYPAESAAYQGRPDLPGPADPARTRELLDLVSTALSPEAAGPFRGHPLRRYGWAYSVLAGRQGTHLDIGAGGGELLRALAAGTDLRCLGVEAHAGYRAALPSGTPPVLAADPGGRLPFADGSVDSVSLLDVLEHVADEEGTLDEIARVLRPGGLLVLTVPAQHAFSVLDPDNVKFRLPRLHRWVYSRRFGPAAYQERFVDGSNGLRGDLAWNRDWHTNYRAADLLGQLDRHGLTPVWREGANLFWRWLQVPELLLPDRWARLLARPLRWDGRTFHRANLHVLARRA